jgi:hypothetical protein
MKRERRLSLNTLKVVRLESLRGEWHTFDISAPDPTLILDYTGYSV